MAEGEADHVPVFRMADGGPALVREALLDLGWSELDRTSDPDGDFNLWWRGGRFKPSELEDARSHGARRINHFSKSNIITRKDSLLRAMRQLRATHGSIYAFTPRGFLLPSEYTKFAKALAAQERKALWICKPSDMSRGRQIFLVRDIGDLTYSHQSVIQEYVHPPLLIEGYKHDLRLYVLVTSCHPLTVYLYQDGLVRFSTEKYDGSDDADLESLFSHLTNASINKKNPERDSRRSVMGAGAKWTLARFQSHLRRRGVDVAALWRRIEAVITLSLLPLATAVPPNPGCFELFGFDVILDTSLRPWVLEVNCSPSLGADCEEDHMVKRPLLRDMLKVLDVPGAMRAKEDKAQRADSSNRGRSRLYSGRPPPRSVIASEPASDASDADGEGSGGAGEGAKDGASGAAAPQRVESAEGDGEERFQDGSGATESAPAPAAEETAQPSAQAVPRGAQSTLDRRRGRETQRPPPPAHVRRSASVGDATGPRRGGAVRSAAHPRRRAGGHAAAKRGAGPAAEWCRDGREIGAFHQVFPFSAESARLADRLCCLRAGTHTPLQLIEIQKAIVAEVKREYYSAAKPCAAKGWREGAAREEPERGESSKDTAPAAAVCKKPPRPEPARRGGGRQPAGASGGPSPASTRSASPVARRPHSAQGSGVEAARMLREGECSGPGP